MKKLLWLVLVGILSLSLGSAIVGCGDDDDDNDTADDDDAADDDDDDTA